MSFQKHPHERGEDGGVVTLQDYSMETPPRAWGRRSSRLEVQGRQGNTPTSVGKTACGINERHIPGNTPTSVGKTANIP